ncbi:Uncharacterised protein [Mycobacteroides abscessus]|nr:Uncharacterised protein [Mycobacteroides abscessus]
MGDDEPFLLEHHDRLAHRAAADAVGGGEVALDETVPGGQVAGGDAFAQVAQHPVAPGLGRRCGQDGHDGDLSLGRAPP